MPLYGSVEEIKTMLRAAPTSVMSADFDARVEGIQAAISSAIEEETGTTFGDSGVAGARTIYAGPNTTLLFDSPARSVSTVSLYGTTGGGIPVDFVEVDDTLWTPYPYDQSRGLIHGLSLLTGGYWGAQDRFGRYTTPVVVVADWADRGAGTEVPADITYIANYLIAETLKAQTAGPAGFTGPDGNTVPIRDPWKNSTVQKILAKYGTNTIGI